MDQKSKIWNFLRKVSVLIIVIVYATTGIVVAMYGLGIHWWIFNPPLQARTYQISSGYNFQSDSVALLSKEDILFAETFCYPYGILITDEPIGVAGIAILRTDSAQTVTSIIMIFQNSLAYPKCNTSTGIPIPGNIILARTLTTDRLEGKATIYFPVEGDYQGIMMLSFANGATQEITIPNLVLHVYPQEELTQLESTHISVMLTYAVFVLTIMGIINIGVDLWPKKGTSQKT